MPDPNAPAPATEEASVPPPSAPLTARRPALLRVVGHALWVGPVVTTLLLVVVVAVAAAADGDPDLAGASGVVVIIAMVMLYGLPVSLACSAAAGLVAGVATAPLRGTSAPRWARAMVGGVAAAAVVGTALTLLWDLWGFRVVGVLVVVVACVVTGAVAVFLAGRADDVFAPDGTSTGRRGAAPWVTAAAATLLTAALVALGFWWLHVVAEGLASDQPVAEDVAVTPPAAVPGVTVPGGGASAGAPSSAAPTSLAQARQELQDLREEAVAAGGDGLLWPEPLQVTEAACTTETDQQGTALTLTGRFTTRDLATATDNVDFLLITQDNEKAAARIVDAWTDGHENTTEMMKGEYYPLPAGAATVETAHVGFDQGVGKIEVATACASDS